MRKKTLVESFKGTGYQKLIENYSFEMEGSEDAQILDSIGKLMSKEYPNWELVDVSIGELFFNNGDRDLYVAVGPKGDFNTK